MEDSSDIISENTGVYLEGGLIRAGLVFSTLLIVGVLLYGASTQKERSALDRIDKPVSIREIVASEPVTPMALEALVFPELESRVAYGDINGDAIQDAVAHIQYDNDWLDISFPTTTPEGRLVVPDPEYLEATTLLFLGTTLGNYQLVQTNISPIDIYAEAEQTGITYDMASTTGSGFALSYGAGGFRCWNSAYITIHFEYDSSRRDWYPVSRETETGCKAGYLEPDEEGDYSIEKQSLAGGQSFAAFILPPHEVDIAKILLE